MFATKYVNMIYKTYLCFYSQLKNIFKMNLFAIFKTWLKCAKNRDVDQMLRSRCS